MYVKSLYKLIDCYNRLEHQMQLAVWIEHKEDEHE